MNSRKLYVTIFLVALFVAVFFIKDRFTVGLYQDEFHYLPAAIFFSNEPVPSLDLLKSYNELNTPIPFILGGWIVNLFGEAIQPLRLLTAFTSFALLMLFVWNSPGQSRRFWLCLAGLLLFPNYYLVSVYYYTDIFAMFFVLAGTVAYLKRAHWAGMLLFIAAVCCRQYMLAFPAAVVAYEIFERFKKTTDIGLLIKSIFNEKTWLYYVLAVLSIVPWVILWKGPAPAAVMAQQHYDSDKLVQYNFGYLLYSSVVIAVYYVIPEMLVTGKLRYLVRFPRVYPKLFIGFILLIASIIFFSPAKQAYNPYFTWPYMGYIDQAFMTVGISGLLKQICFGLLALITLMRFFSPHFNLASWMVAFNILLLGKAQLSWDKYSLPVIMALWFLAMFNAHWSLSRSEELALSSK
ncbi:hypothetical protein DYBT9623_03777 [Dyadobacter sp. CECT 9623]|uniref:Dolichyl-phosphate-mannose-protein mannosyltransferase n=1 Tax=Dyadobacter linearis TaxID=2823330 RepID=A0ABM8UU30_9BACT|nr:hypothetical protein [Dyadobacter sp. CECT 9623]CAG5071791.1 hypothetical protein DYBT9623_03777 [Dyadobacter sp. CECT 9623]